MVRHESNAAAGNVAVDDDAVVTMLVEEEDLDHNSSNNNNNNITKKRRRLSRKEHKDLKKQQKKKKQKQQHQGDKDGGGSLENKAVVAAQDTADNNDQSSSSVCEKNDYLASYVPTPLLEVNDTQQQLSTKATPKSLGKWFPKAVTMKRPLPTTTAATDKPSPKTVALLLFYQYVTPVWSEQRYQQVLQQMIQIGTYRTTLAGRIRIAPEGFNCTLSAMDSSTTTALETLHHFTRDLQTLVDPVVFASTDFKFLSNYTSDRQFNSLTILPVKELVYYGLQDTNAPLTHGGKHVSPQEFHQLLGGHDLPVAEEDTAEKKKEKQPLETVVIDVRNHYEAALGRFDGQQQLTKAATTMDATTTGTESDSKETSAVATYIDPKMRKSTDFPEWVAQHKDELVGKRVLLYCTGGIRCERASAHLQTTIPGAAEVYQLQGGIEKYLQTFPDGGYWRGKNFTFDKREAVSVGNWNGDGGVIRKTTTTTSKQQATESTSSAPPTAVVLPECVCAVCSKPWDRYVGKKKCSTCGVPILMCDTCMSTRKKDDPQITSARCPLCVEQNVTVRATDVDWTRNGVQTVTPTTTTTMAKCNNNNHTAGHHDNTTASTTMDNNNSSNALEELLPKASKTVLKWGGGYAKEKKVQRKWKRTPCRFGMNCSRADCLFAHPTPTTNNK